MRASGEASFPLTRTHAPDTQAIDRIGVPPTEVGGVDVNGDAATLARTLRENDFIEVFPHDEKAASFESPLALPSPTLT